MSCSQNLTFTSSTSPSEGDRLEGGFVVSERIEDRIVADGLTFTRRAYAAVRPDGQAITGSAADQGDIASPRAFGELLERAATLAAMHGPELVERDASGAELGVTPAATIFRDTGDPRTRFARSNGVALASSWQAASASAAHELIERDSIMRSWLGETAPSSLDAPSLPAMSRYSWRAVALPVAPWFREHASHVVFVCAFPLDRDLPLLRGSACRPTRQAALDDAVREALQGLAFLWGEPIPDASPAPEPTAIFHLDHYLCEKNHEALRSWLDGGRYTGVPTSWSAPSDPRVRWVDLTPRAAPYCVAAAWSAAAIPVIFGVWPSALAGAACDLAPHPIA